MNQALSISRRRLLGAGTATAALGMPFVRRARAQAYPSRDFRVVIPTGQGGGAERLARAFDEGWSKLLGQRFEYEFFPGAAGQVGYELFVHRRDHDGYNLLFGNMGPEMLMYATQDPNFRFPEDFIYFCRLDIDDSGIFVSRNSPFQSVEQIVDEAKRRPLNVAVSRIPHPASIGLFALAEATGAQFNLIPYGGGNPTQVAVINGEADLGALPIAGIMRLRDQFKIVGIFNTTENLFAEGTENAPLINQVFGTDIPDLYSSRSWAVHTDWADSNPDEFAVLERTSREVFDEPEFQTAIEQVGQEWESISYGDRETCTRYAQDMLELADRYREQLTGQ
jgi:Tripartite tricarboxylate transporter family receptor